MNRFLMILISVGFGTFGLACQARPAPVHDYMFAVTGVVTTEDGAPIKDVEINLEVNGPVYKGVELIRTVKCMTDDTGGFVFTYTSHKRGVKYSITVRKEDFESQTVSGSSPPASHHTIHLKRAAGSGVPHAPVSRVGVFSCPKGGWAILCALIFFMRPRHGERIPLSQFTAE